MVTLLPTAKSVGIGVRPVSSRVARSDLVRRRLRLLDTLRYSSVASDDKPVTAVGD